MIKKNSKPRAKPAPKADDISGEPIPFTDHQIEYMESLRRTGLYGRTLADVLNALVLEGLRSAVARGIIPKHFR